MPDRRHRLSWQNRPRTSPARQKTRCCINVSLAPQSFDPAQDRFIAEFTLQMRYFLCILEVVKKQ